MLEIIPAAAADILAFRISGHIDRIDVETVLARLETALAANERTHLFVEIEDFQGIDFDALARDIAGGLALLGKLRRFGRIAVVSDASWIRWASKIESALLPFVSYETFTAAQREQALAWVRGEQPLPHGSTLRIIESDKPDVFGFELDGKISAAEIDRLAKHFNEAMAEHDRVSVVGRIRDFGGLELRCLLDSDYWAMKRTMLEKLNRYAFVGGPDWLKRWVDTLSPLLRVNIQVFDEDEEDAAWRWVKAKPKTKKLAVAA